MSAESFFKVFGTSGIKAAMIILAQINIEHGSGKVRNLLKNPSALMLRRMEAVRAGFEPAVQFNPYGSLANY